MKTGERTVDSSSKRGRYLYADYSPLEENIDFLSQLRDFSGLSDTIFQAHNDFEQLRSEIPLAISVAGIMSP